MTQAKPNTFDGLSQEALDFLVDQGHLSADAPVWGMIQGLTRTYLEGLKRRGLMSAAAVDAVLQGKS